MWIIVAGNPKDGFDYTGPFDDYDEALKLAEMHRTKYGADEWWICELQPVPTSYREETRS